MVYFTFQLKNVVNSGGLSAYLYTPTASFDVLSKCLKRMAIGNSKLVARLKENKRRKKLGK